VVSVCDRVREVCPPFPGHHETVHWSIADPSALPAGDGDAAFQQTAAELETRVGFLLAAMTPKEER
jgi:hypothetical protein